MLVLSRHRGETIRVDDDMVITVVDIRGDKVRIGFDAPKSVVVHRNEVYEAINRTREPGENDPPNIAVARRLREIADIIENFNFPIRVEFYGHEMTDDQIDQVKNAFSEQYFCCGSHDNAEWEQTSFLDKRIRLTCFKARGGDEVQS
jgi:carbon storage regulator